MIHATTVAHVILTILMPHSLYACALHTGPEKVSDSKWNNKVPIYYLNPFKIACSSPIDDSSKSLESFLQSFMKKNYNVYQITEEDNVENNINLVDEDDRQQQSIESIEENEENEDVEQENEDVEGIIEIP